MSFWGIEITKSKPVTHRFDKERAVRLRITQASIGFPLEEHCHTCAVRCSVGGKTPITLCVLNSDTNGSSPLDIEFNEEDREVVFSVDHGNLLYGNPKETKVHLSGYYIEKCNNCGSTDNNGKFIIVTIIYFDVYMDYCNFRISVVSNLLIELCSYCE
ncbi:hypothetical protein MKW94_024936 [Papaver nudicaule]|uniref:Nucleoplasmin-like domain-containing protein n=1 Tax=Papaver nudicaule TaxID=74823 RepID=A0AA41VX35_PAPNU|nr:hypothetical protein [Papaver nudicaule]